MEDKRNILKESSPFSWKISKNEKVLVFYNQKMIKTVKGKNADKLIRLIQSGADPYDIQLFLAKLTGNFKRGNEKSSKNQ